jgi:4-alpha-glucanotransferase
MDHPVLKINLARALARNLRCRQFLQVPVTVEQAEAVFRPKLLAITMTAPLQGAEETLFGKMIKILGLEREQIVFGQTPAKVRMDLRTEAPATAADANWCWRPQALLDNPSLKAQAYQQLKAIKKQLSDIA